MLTGVGVLTAAVGIVNTGELVTPSATVTDDGTAAVDGLLLVKVITAPPAGAGAFSVKRFPVVDTPPDTDAGDNVSADTVSGFTTSVSVLLMPL